MHHLNSKLGRLAARISSGDPIRIAVFGLGSVGTYLLDYLMSWPEENVELHICGRSYVKVAQDINIVRVANLIRCNRTKPVHFHAVDLNNLDEIAGALAGISPDFIVNSSRVYSGLKYGSISWKNIRAYGLWSPLSVKFIRNIMLGYERAGCGAIVINTSYSDAVNRWLKSAGLICPDFGSGNLNHLVPRIKLAAAELAGIADSTSIEVTLATSHFHDVVISKEGHTENLDPLVHLGCAGKTLDLDMNAVYRKCAIPMPADAKRNMMNASSNFEIIGKIVEAIRHRSVRVVHSPGVAGHIGGYPVAIDFREGISPDRHVSFVEDYFTLERMEAHNRRSITLDGIEDVAGGVLTYTDALREKVKKAFGVEIRKTVPFDAIEETADFIISRIITPALGAGA